jgi:hypothetical protein
MFSLQMQAKLAEQQAQLQEAHARHQLFVERARC